MKSNSSSFGWRRRSPVWRMIALISLLVTVFNPLASSPTAAAPSYNYAEALQKSIYFYDAEKSGPGITGGRLEWRGDSDLSDLQVPLKPMGADGTGTNLSQAFINANRAALDPDGNGSLDLSGGMHDAGDHVKFGMPQTYAASTLGWSYYHFKDAFQNANEDQHMREILKWFGDYFLRSTFRNGNGDVVAFAYQVGEGSVDHQLWAPPELHNLARPAYLATSETPASDQAAAAAAALALTYLNFRDTDPTYANRCLSAAQALYRFARQYRGLGYSGGFYNSSFDEDELSWAAIWLYRATNDQSYINDIVSADASGMNTGWLKKIVRSSQDNWQNIWVHSWDTVWGGVFLELAPITDNPKHWYYARWNLEYWSGIAHEDPADGTFLAGTPAGFKVISTWGSARYNAAAQLQAFVYRKYTGRTDFTDWAKTQMDYIMGSNPFGYSLIVGFPSPELSVKHPHHRAAHGSVNNSMFDPPEHRHVLWGALAGGPDYEDVHKDLTNDFVYNEVAIDYNAGLVGALAGFYKYYGAGQQPLPNFPPLEPPETAYTDQGKIEQESNQRSQIAVRLTAVPTHPPHLATGLKARYFFDISEMVAVGQTINDVRVEVYYDEQASAYGGKTVVSNPIAWDAANNIYYVELDWSASAIYGKRDLQFGLVAAQASDWASHWDPSNDWSHQGLSASALGDTQYIPVYLNGTKVYGQEPSLCTNCPTPTRTPTGVTNTPSTNTPTATRTPTFTPTATQPIGNNTGWISPSGQASQSGGDGNGFQSSPANVFADGGGVATDTDSGNGTSTSCTSTNKDRHAYFNYPLSLPAGSSITGIEVRTDARADSTSGSPRFCVELSWNNGASWTALKTGPTLATSERTDVLGSSSDTWGRTWNPSELNSANFRVRIVSVASSTSRDFSLDWIPVRVWYSNGGVTSTPTSTPSPGQPDLVVASIAWSPASPQLGSTVLFSAVVRNNGTGPSPAGVIHDVCFNLTSGLTSPVQLCSTTSTAAIPVGGSATLQANQTWTVTVDTNYTVTVTADTGQRITESDETNNTLARALNIQSTPTPTQATATHTPTFTPTGVTITPTFTPTIGTTTLRLQYRAADTNAGDNQIKPHFRIVNAGTSAVPLSELKIRYWFTREGTQSQSFWCDWAAIPGACSNVSGTFIQLSPARTGADFYLEVSFAAAAGSIPAGGQSGEVQARFAKSDWSNYTETGDYSFDPTKTSFADWTRVTLYRNGVLVWGVEP